MSKHYATKGNRQEVNNTPHSFCLEYKQQLFVNNLSAEYIDWNIQSCAMTCTCLPDNRSIHTDIQLEH